MAIWKEKQKVFSFFLFSLLISHMTWPYNLMVATMSTSNSVASYHQNIRRWCSVTANLPLPNVLFLSRYSKESPSCGTRQATRPQVQLGPHHEQWQPIVPCSARNKNHFSSVIMKLQLQRQKSLDCFLFHLLLLRLSKLHIFIGHCANVNVQ